MPLFERVVIGKHHFLDSPADRELVMSIIPSCFHFKALWKDGGHFSPTEKWKWLRTNVEILLQNQAPTKPEEKENYQLLQMALPRLVLHAIYPRLDVNVSSSLQHLLKSPFSLHPNTAKVCLVIDPQQIHTLDPFTDIPSLFDLERDLNKNPSLPRPHLETFNQSLRYFEKMISAKDKSKKRFRERTRTESPFDIEDLVKIKDGRQKLGVSDKIQDSAKKKHQQNFSVIL